LLSKTKLIKGGGRSGLGSDATAVISGLTLFREKSTIHRLGASGDDVDDDSIVTVRSNRVSLSLKVGRFRENIVVRGQNIPATLRLAALVIEHFHKDPTIFTDEGRLTEAEWRDLWARRVSSYERQFIPESWVALHHNGEAVFTTTPTSQIDEIERLAQGGDIDEELIHKVSQRLFGTDDDVVTQHDSQTAVVFTPFKDYHRAAILERRNGRTGSFAVSAHHPPKPRRNVRYSGFINYCADIIEAMNIKLFLERLKQMVEDNQLSGPPVTPDRVAAAMGRKRELIQFLASFERANKITFRPERPDIE